MCGVVGVGGDCFGGVAVVASVGAGMLPVVVRVWLLLAVIDVWGCVLLSVLSLLVAASCWL